MPVAAPTPPETIARIRQMRAEGATRLAITRACGVCETTVKRYTQDIPVQNRRNIKLPDPGALLVLAETMTIEAIAHDYYCGIDSVKAALKKAKRISA
jgi:hypothetical protein